MLYKLGTCKKLLELGGGGAKKEELSLMGLELKRATQM